MTLRYEDMNVEEWVGMLMRNGEIQTRSILDSKAKQYGKEQAEKKKSVLPLFDRETITLFLNALAKWVIAPALIGAVIALIIGFIVDGEGNHLLHAMAGGLVFGLPPLGVLILLSIGWVVSWLYHGLSGDGIALFGKSHNRLETLERRSSEVARGNMLRDLENALPIYENRSAERDAQREAERKRNEAEKKRREEEEKKRREQAEYEAFVQEELDRLNARDERNDQ